jgi:hypothetical protein
MNELIDVRSAGVDPVGRAVPETDDLSSETQAISACPRFDVCNAPICPLDPNVLDREHLKGEAVCHYLRLYAKDSFYGLKPGSLPANLAIRVVQSYPRLIARYAPLKKALLRAAKSPSKGFLGGQDRG